ncbi:hypothetical protein Llon_1652, partial [Legionella londiniensis]
ISSCRISLHIHYEKILLLAAIILREDYQRHLGKKLSRTEFENIIFNPEFKYQIEEYHPISNYFEHHGVTCFTPDPENASMWTYYANEHKGICLEFELDFSKILKPTKYPPSEISRFSSDVSNGNILVSFYLEEHEFVFTKVKYTSNISLFLS